jgi:predicted ATPase/transcriptional regulator with XRE-family HTH domain/tetratricopeptide (TPR) repeat protein
MCPDATTVSGKRDPSMAAPSSLTFGALLKRHRLAAGLTQEGLAERAGVSARGVQDLERGVHAPRADTVRLLANALGLDGEAHAALIETLHPELAATPVPTPARLDLPGPPIPPTPLVGREREVAAACAMLRPADRAAPTRLLTLTGPGGVGKTRLALAIAGELAGDFRDGVGWVELAPLRDPGLVATAIAQALGVRESGDRPLTELLASYLAERRLLLVLDNLEHLLPAVPLIATLLAASADLAILATSRARLHLRGEVDIPVAPLAVPGAIGGARPMREGLAGVAAVRLFLERAAEVRPGFMLTEENAPAVAEICRRLDGLPLAIELAAVRVRVLSPAALLTRLEHRLPFLTGGARDLPRRQQTMGDTIAWSHDLLSSEEQALFRRVAVFSGGFTLEAAEWVSGVGSRVPGKAPAPHLSSSDTRHPAPGTLDLIASLVDQSLVRPVEGCGDEPRFTMLETIREYGLIRLSERGEAEDVRRAHAGYCLALAERAESELTGPAQAEWLDRLEAEHANVRSALDWCFGGDETDMAVRLVGAPWHFWQVRGHVGEGRAWAETAVARGNTEPTLARARALRAAGLLAEYHGDYGQAVARHEAAAAVWRVLGDERNLARTLDHLGNCAHDQGDFARAARLHEEALALARKAGDTRGIASALGNLGIMAIHIDQLETARLRLEEALTLLRALDHAHGVAHALSNLGVVAMREGDMERAMPLLAEALGAWRELGDQDEAASTLVKLSEAERLVGNLDRAMARCEEGRELFALLGNMRASAGATSILATIAHEQGDAPRAAALFGASLSRAQEVDDKLTLAASLEGLASLATRGGQAERAARLLGAAAALRDAIGAPVATHLRTGYDRVLAESRAGIDAATFAAAWDEGHALPLDRTISRALALAEELAWSIRAGSVMDPRGLHPSRARPRLRGFPLFGSTHAQS